MALPKLTGSNPETVTITKDAWELVAQNVNNDGEKPEVILPGQVDTPEDENVEMTDQQVEEARERKLSINQSKAITYTIELNLTSSEDVEKALLAGVHNPEVGLQRKNVSGSTLEDLRSEGLSFTIIGGVTEF